jgi:HD-like signal output (HDOD) protein
MIDALLVDPGQDIRQLEAMRSLPGHEHCVAVMFESWQLPASLIAAVSHHHAPLEAPLAQRPLAALLHLGLQLAQASGHGFPLEPAAPARDPALLELLGLEAEQLDLVQAALPERLAQLQRALADV